MNQDLIEAIATRIGVFKDELMDPYNMETLTVKARTVFYAVLDDSLMSRGAICLEYPIFMQKLRQILDTRHQYESEIADCKRWVKNSQDRLEQFRKLSKLKNGTN